jgi:ATP-dependent Clp protease ATP-binding subunit ClpA
MFERFTDRARRVLVLAQEEARLLNHNFIGTEHILLGLIHEEDGVAAKALESLGIGLDGVRSKVIETIGPPGISVTGSPPFTPRAKKVLELSLREALQLGHNYIGTEHMLLGIAREGEGVAAQVLVNLGADLSQVRQAVMQLLSFVRPSDRHDVFRVGRSQGGWAAAESAPIGGSARLHARTPAALRVDIAARRLAAGMAVGTHHLLVGIFEQPDSLAARVLASLHIDRAAVEQTVAKLGIKDTSDELPEVAGGRRVTLGVVEGRLVVEVDDPELTALVRRGLAAADDEAASLRGDDPDAAAFSGIWTAVKAAAEDVGKRRGLTFEVEGHDLLPPPTEDL